MMPPNVHQGTASFNFDIGDRTVTVTAKFLSPTEAQDLLLLNTRNRVLRQSDVDAMAADIKNGDWQFTGETIKLARGSDGDFLADAQHRLAAIAIAGIAVPVLIVDGLDPEVTETIDQGRPRRVGDILRMTYGHTSIKNESTVSALASLVLALNNPGKRFGRKAVAEYADRNLDKLSFWAQWAKALAGDCDSVQMNGSRLASAMAAAPLGALAMHMVGAGADVDLVRDFFARITYGNISDSDATNVIPLLRRRQRSGIPLSRITGGGSSSIPLLMEFSIYISGFNRWVSDEPVQKFQAPTKFRPKTLADLPDIAAAGKAVV